MYVAASRVDITPSGAVFLAGERKRRRAFAVAERLEANVVALRTHEGEPPTVIVSMDLLYPGRLVRELVEECFHWLPPQNILLGSSHTHRGPMTDDTKSRLGTVDHDYLKHVKERFVSVRALEHTSDWTESHIYKGRADANGAVNRRLRKRLVVSRRPRLNGFVNAPNPAGFKDETLKMLVGRSSEGRAVFVLWSYACHPVGYPTADQVAAHFPALVRTRIRERVGDPNLPVVYLQGFSGNVRPSASVQLNGLSRRCRSMVTGPVFSDMSPSGYSNWCEDLAKVALAALDDARYVEVRGIRNQRAALKASLFVAGAPESNVTFQSIRLVPSVCIVGASAELVAEYVPIVRGMAASEDVFCVGCLDHVFGYAPTTQILKEGGYEAGDFCDAFGLEGVHPDIETSMRSGFEQVLRIERRSGTNAGCWSDETDNNS